MCVQHNINRLFDRSDRDGLRATGTGLQKRSIQVGAVEARWLGNSQCSGVPGVVASRFVRIGVHRLHLAVVARLALVRKTCVGVPGHQREHPNRQRHEDAAVD